MTQPAYPARDFDCVQFPEDRPHEHAPPHGGHPHPRPRRPHLRAGGLGHPQRLGRRGHQDRAHHPRRRGPRPRRRAAWRCSPARCRRSSSTPTAASSASRSTSTRTRAARSSTSSPPISDVFLTNKMPSVREKLKTDIDDIRAHNPNIIYVSGHGYGARGPDRDAGGYDAISLLVPRHERHEREGARRDDGPAACPRPRTATPSAR